MVGNTITAHGSMIRSLGGGVLLIRLLKRTEDGHLIIM